MKNIVKTEDNFHIGYRNVSPAQYLAIFEQGGSADIFSLITGGWGGGRDDTSKSVIVTLSNLWGAIAPPAPPR